jgi:aspartyl-tRNA(Asn)/glutamyl-tRNA(Gln) amidotransferase subunit B
MFSRTPNHFGDEPNTNVGLIDSGQPGTLPILNKAAVKKAIDLGCGLHAEVSSFSAFDRKSYFYPDSPRNYQITQFFHPILKGGYVMGNVDGKMKRFAIREAHLEDDSGMLRHFSSFTGVDYNRAGAPLIEIVTEPCITCGKEASAFASALRLILIYLDISNGNMEEGSMRMDVNISVRPRGEEGLRNKTEIKNMNSFSNMELAIEAEVKRQIDAYTAAPSTPHKEVVPSTTLRFDLPTKTIFVMRSKVGAEDYRYFPEPDLPPLCITQEQIEEARRNLPELPEQRHTRYIEVLKLSDYQATLLMHDKALADYFEQGLAGCNNPKALCNWVTVEFIGKLKDTGKNLLDISLPAQHITSLVNLIENKILTGKVAKILADEMIKAPHKSPQELMKEHPHLIPMQDIGEIETIVQAVLDKNPQSILDYNKGISKAFNFLIGQIMQATQGKASPDIVQQVLLKKLTHG